MEEIVFARISRKTNYELGWHNEHGQLEMRDPRAQRICLGKRGLLTLHGFSLGLSSEASEMLLRPCVASSECVSFRNCLSQHIERRRGLEAFFDNPKHFARNSEAS